MFKGLDQDSVSQSLVNILSFTPEFLVSHMVAPQCSCHVFVNLWEGPPELILELALCPWCEKGQTDGQEEGESGQRERQTQERGKSERGDMTYEASVRTLTAVNRGASETEI